MRPDPERVEHYRQLLETQEAGPRRSGYVAGEIHQRLRDIARIHERRCAGCEACYELGEAIALTEAHWIMTFPGSVPAPLRLVRDTDESS